MQPPLGALRRGGARRVSARAGSAFTRLSAEAQGFAPLGGACRRRARTRSRAASAMVPSGCHVQRCPGGVQVRCDLDARVRATLGADSSRTCAGTVVAGLQRGNFSSRPPTTRSLCPVCSCAPASQSTLADRRRLRAVGFSTTQSIRRGRVRGRSSSVARNHPVISHHRTFKCFKNGRACTYLCG